MEIETDNHSNSDVLTNANQTSFEPSRLILYLTVLPGNILTWWSGSGRQNIPLPPLYGVCATALSITARNATATPGAISQEHLTQAEAR